MTNANPAQLPDVTGDDTVTVRMTVDVEVKVSRSAWAREWGLDPANGPAVQQDIRRYLTHNVVEGWGSTMVDRLGGMFTPTVVQPSPHTLLVVEGYDLHSMLDALNGRKQLHTFRLDPRPNGFAWKVNEGGWSPTVGKRVIAG